MRSIEGCSRFGDFVDFRRPVFESSVESGILTWGSCFLRYSVFLFSPGAGSAIYQVCMRLLLRSSTEKFSRSLIMMTEKRLDDVLRIFLG